MPLKGECKQPNQWSNIVKQNHIKSLWWHQISGCLW